MRTVCTTYFDCSATGTTGHYRVSDQHRIDRIGNAIDEAPAWNRSRNQQRNWETLLQLIGLRCQPQDIDLPCGVNGVWSFSFWVDVPDVFGSSYESLYRDCRGVPMLTGLTESHTQESAIHIDGPGQNIWFESINI